MRFALAIISSLFFVSTASASFPDTADHQFEYFIDRLQEQEVVEGNPDGTFAPERTVNRAEFLKMLMLASGHQLLLTEDQTCFTDFSGTEQWYWVYACSAKSHGIVDGHPDGSFRGEVTVNLAEAAKMTLEAFDVPLPQYIRAPDNWYDPYIDTAAGAGLFQELPNIPNLPLTRAEATVVLSLLDPNFVDNRSSSSSSSVTSSSVVSTNNPVCGNGILETSEQCDDGNVENGDGCSKACIIVEQPVYHGSLRIEQRPLSATSVTAGKQDVLLLAFDAIAGRQNVFLTQLQFTSDVGSLESGTNYQLYYDANQDGTVDTLFGSAVPQNEQLTFAGLNIPVLEGYYTRVELRADVQQSGSPSSFSVQLATTEPDYVLGVDAVDGREVSGIETNNQPCALVSICWIAVYTQSSRLISLGSSPGSLYVTKSSTPVRNHQILLGELSNVLLRLNFTATDEDIQVTKVRIGGGNTSLDALQLYLAGSSSAFATARSSACETVVSGQYCADVDLTIPKDSDVQVLVRATALNDNEGGSSGATAALSLSASIAGSSVAIEAEGTASLSQLSQNGGDTTEEGEIFIGRSSVGVNTAIVGPTHDVVAAKIASITNSHADPDDSAIPVGLTDFATFKFTAESHTNIMNGLNSVALEDITFNITASNVQFAASSIELFNPANSSVAISCSQSATTGVISVTCSSLDTGSLQAFIAPGESLELSLRGNLTNTQIQPGTSTLQASIQGLGTRNSGPISWNDEVVTWVWVDTEQSSVRSTTYRSQ